MTTTKGYDFLNRLQSIHSTRSSSSQPVGTSYVYNQANQRIRAKQADETYWAYEYDALGQVMSGKKYFADGSLVPGMQNEYVFDDIGNRTATYSGGDTDGNLRTSAYTANSVNQYSSRSNEAKLDVIGLAPVGSTVTINADSSGIFRKGEFFRKEFSGSNNSYPGITTIATEGASSSTNGPAYAFIAPATENYTHDTDGNLTVDGRWNYTWDGENRLKQMESKVGYPSGSQRKLVFEYDSFGRRTRMTIYLNGSLSASSDIKFLYDGWNLLAELDGSNTTIRSYIWGLDLSGSLQGAGGVGGMIAMRTNNVAHFAAFDGNGNVSGLVDATTGTLSAQYDYDPFGQTLRATGIQAKWNPFRFSTKYTDPESDHLYYGHRFYNPSTGR